MDRQKSKERKEMQRDDRKKNGPIEVDRERCELALHAFSSRGQAVNALKISMEVLCSVCRYQGRGLLDTCCVITYIHFVPFPAMLAGCRHTSIK